MAEIFISYSRKDRDFASRLRAALREEEREGWIDWQGIPISAEWMQEIYEAVDAAHTFLFIISPDSIASKTCRLELAYALRREKRLVPVMALAVSAKELPADLATIQYISFADEPSFQSAFDRLIEALDTDLDWAKEHARLLVLAEEWDRKDRDVGYLLRGNALHKAERWLAEPAPERQALLPIHRQFIGDSRRQTTRRRRTLLATAAAVLVAIVAISTIAARRAEDAREERALKLTAHANRDMFHYPGRAYATALTAETIHPAVSEARIARDTAQAIIQQRMDLAARERENRDTGSAFNPLEGAFPGGRLTARISEGGRYVLIASERGETWNDPPGEAYLFDNESLRATKLEPSQAIDRIRRRLSYVGFSASGKKIYLARHFNVEIYNLEGRFENGIYVSSTLENEFSVSSTKYPITLVDGIEEDELLVVGDSTGPVWIVDPETRRARNHFFRYNSQNPLIRFALSPSGKTAILVLKNGEAHFWNLDGKPELVPPRVPHEGTVEVVLYKPTATEETWLTAGEDGVARLWEFRDGKIEPGPTFEHGDEAIGHATFLESSPRLATFTYAGQSRVWDLESESPAQRQ